MKKIRQAIAIITNLGIFKMLMGFYWYGYFRETGWFNAYRLKKPVDEFNEPIPWVTYSFIDFIKERLKKNMTILEYGSGNSTLFYSKYAKQVYAVEHDAVWFRQISASLPANAKVFFVDLEYDGNYSRFARQLHERVDVIIIDGRDRVNCIKQSIGSVTIETVFVLDDSERKPYAEGVSFLLDRGFRKLDFWGISPGLFYKKCTSVFYRNGNCLNI